MNKKLSIIIPVYNKWPFTRQCLNDLKHLSGANEIIIIDNNSSDETNVEMTKWTDLEYKSFIDNQNIVTSAYYRNDENVFHSKACNQGFKISTGDNILFLNNDIRIKSNHSNWTDKIISACESSDGLFGPTMGLLDNNLNFVKEANEQLSGNSYLSGWCIAANRNTWNKLDINNNGQIWNEQFPFYFNDGDLSFTARKLDIPINIISIPELVHFGKISSSQLNVNKLYNEGRQKFIKKWKK